MDLLKMLLGAINLAVHSSVLMVLGIQLVTFSERSKDI